MKITLIGATSFVGSDVLKEALERSHEVTAIIRHPAKLTPQSKLHPHNGNVCNVDEVARMVAGHEAVISAFNPGSSYPRHLQSVGQEHASHYRRMKKAKVKRRLFIVGAGSLEVKPRVPSSVERMPSTAAEYQMVVVSSPG